MSTETKSRPILFSGSMIRAILEGRKTQTRRAMKPQPILEGDRYVWGKTGIFTNAPLISYKSPYGTKNEFLWVRETWANIADDDRPDCFAYKADVGTLAQYKIWKPSIHMPRAASRITLEITDVRVQRLQEISEEDAIAEGVERTEQGWKCYGNCKEHKDGYIHRTSATASFMTLWDSINGDTCPWNSNPYVWAVSFKRIDQAIASQQGGAA